MKHKLACIVCEDFQWSKEDPRYKQDCPVIYALRMPSETEKQFKEKLDKALATLLYGTLYRYVSFSVYAMPEFMKEMEVIEIIDYPGAPTVKLKINFTCERLFYLPRDPDTGEFVNIADQTQCLSILKHPAERSN